MPHQAIEDFLRVERPDATWSCSASGGESYTLDIAVGAVTVAVQFSPRLGFGVSTLASEGGPLAEHDREFASVDDVVAHLREVLSGRKI